MCGIAALLMYLSGYKLLMIVCIIITIANFWSFGIMHNYAVLAARKSGRHMQHFNDFTPGEANQAPDLITGINMVSTILGFIFLLIALGMILF